MTLTVSGIEGGGADCVCFCGCGCFPSLGTAVITGGAGADFAAALWMTGRESFFGLSGAGLTRGAAGGLVSGAGADSLAAAPATALAGLFVDGSTVNKSTSCFLLQARTWTDSAAEP